MATLYGIAYGYGSSPSHRGPSAQYSIRPTRRPPGSRARSMRACQVLRPRRVVQVLAFGALGHIAFHYTDSVGTRNHFSIAAQWLACTLPCRRFADILADACARLGADVGRYSFIAVDLHHLLLVVG